MKENLQKDLGKEPTEGELAEATDIKAVQIRKLIEVGRAARNKLIKVVFFWPFSPTSVVYAELFQNVSLNWCSSEMCYKYV